MAQSVGTSVIIVRPKHPTSPFLYKFEFNTPIWGENRELAQYFASESQAEGVLGDVINAMYRGDVPVGAARKNFLIDLVQHPEVEEAYIFCQARDYNYLPVLLEYRERAGEKSLGAICGRAVANNISDLIEEMVERSKNK